MAAGIARGVGGNAQFDLEVGRMVAGPVVGWRLSAGFVIRNPLAPLGCLRR